jgi:hypothetical protein
MGLLVDRSALSRACAWAQWEMFLPLNWLITSLRLPVWPLLSISYRIQARQVKCSACVSSGKVLVVACHRKERQSNSQQRRMFQPVQFSLRSFMKTIEHV